MRIHVFYSYNFLFPNQVVDTELTNWLAPRSSVLLEQPRVAHIAKKFTALYVNRRFATDITGAHNKFYAA